MTDRVKPERPPSVPANDQGPFFCYPPWSKSSRAYCVGYTGEPGTKTRRHFKAGVKTAQDHQPIHLSTSEPMDPGNGQEIS